MTGVSERSQQRGNLKDNGYNVKRGRRRIASTSIHLIIHQR
ncbi:hypothetical protein [Photorhabdus bodei]|nr:hypothetical protein [Photorhabdus bodei]